MCRDYGFYGDAVSRAYYAIMHSAKAALEVRHVQVATHSGLRNQFGLHLVRTGLVEADWGTCITDAFRDRLKADYEATVVFDEADAQEACETAAAFLDRIRLLLPPEVSGDSTASRP